MNEIKKGPGRPKGSITGARQIVYTVVDKDSQSFEEFKTPAGTTEEDLKKYTVEFISNLYKNEKKYIKPIVFGPFYYAKGIAKSAKLLHNSLSENEEFDSYLGNGEFGGWNGKIFSLKNEAMFVAFVPFENLDGKSVIKPIEKILLSLIQNLKKEYEEVTV